MTPLLDGLELHPLLIPMRHRFRQVGHREVILIRGPSGWGEFSPFPEYPPGVAARWLGAALELATGLLPDPGMPEIEVNVTVPAVDAATAASIARESGARTAKVKIGDPGDDETVELRRLEAVAEALGAGGRMRVDVNGAWDLDIATRRLRNMEQFDLEYAEQPVATIEDMRELRTRVATPLAADELVRTEDDPLRVIEEGGADILILKVQPMGGVGPVLGLAARSPAPVVISSALETSVGMYGGLLAASHIESPYAFGLGTVSLLEGDPTLMPLVSHGGRLEVRRPEPDPGLLERWRAPDDDARMLTRLRLAAEATP